MQIQGIEITKIGFPAYFKLCEEYPLLSAVDEQELIRENNQHALYLHLLRVPLSIAKAHRIRWASFEQMIDVALLGLQKGIETFMNKEHPEYRIASYVVWWIRQACEQHTIEIFINLLNSLQFKLLNPEEELQLALAVYKEDEAEKQRYFHKYMPLAEKVLDKYKPGLDHKMVKKSKIQELLLDACMKESSRQSIATNSNKPILQINIVSNCCRYAEELLATSNK